MTVSLTDQEWAFLSGIPEEDLVQMAVDLDILFPADPDLRAVLELCIGRLIEVLPTDGLPLSKYDRDDLAELPPSHLAGLARLVGLPPSSSVDQILKAGIKAHTAWTRSGRGRGVPLLVPTLLPALARIGAQG